MGVRAGATTCANTSMSTWVALARNNARAQTSTVTHEVSQAQASNIGLLPGRHPEGASHVMGECVSSGLAEAISFMLQR
jgi:hypothetical protein